ncbi:hypothetical protein CAEBREN_29455 [Caenorhabditis brenneri]|uniref:Uncharacterized protein n=1 Tax=Caenorhabditis brenneri TaxID=135651 RepID=G0NK91_CAEBE|nr:hypothetical protein CAEBREN_29455 [Caenorhabditis brenneri]
MAPITYAKITSKNLPPSVSKNAPMAPKCPVRLEISETKLKIQYKPGKENSCGVVFEREYVEHRITREIESFSISDHHEDLQHVAAVFRCAMKMVWADSQSFLTGSFAAGVDIERSDLDFVVNVPSLKEGNPFQQLMEMKKELRKFNNIFEKVFVQKGHVPVLKLTDRDRKVSIDVSMDNGTSKRNTKLLSLYGQVDARFPLLCKAMKAWASKVGVEGAKRARLNSFSLCLMLIQYLQMQKVLPNLQEIFPELNGEFLVENDNYEEKDLKEKIIKEGKFKLDENKSSLAALFLGFLKYYADFDFKKYWISVRNGRIMEKRWDEEGKPLDGMPDKNRYIVVEDPFLKVPRNCAGTVRQTDYVEKIQFEFQQEYDRILKNRTIFNMGPCNWSRILTKNGKKRDLQRQIELKAYWRTIVDDIPWGTTSEPSNEYMRSPPEDFWNLGMKKEKKYAKVTEWPELQATARDYDLIDNYID